MVHTGMSLYVDVTVGMTQKCLTPAVVHLFILAVAHVFCDPSKCSVFRGSVDSFLSPMLAAMAHGLVRVYCTDMLVR